MGVLLGSFRGITGKRQTIEYLLGKRQFSQLISTRARIGSSWSGADSCRPWLKNLPSILSTSIAHLPSSTRHASWKHNYDWRIAAAYSAKNAQFDPSRHLFSFARPESTPFIRNQVRVPFDQGQPVRAESGQDSFFISPVGNSENVAFGVADGVGGWIESGIDSADFSHGLCYQMARTLSSMGRVEAAKLSPQDLLEAGYAYTVHDSRILGGGSTACVAIGNNLGQLTVANLGDSGFSHMRLNNMRYQSRAQTHGFNTPYQLSLIPPYMMARSRRFGGMPLRDLPTDADVTRHQLEQGDVLVVATDGLWDNLSHQSVSNIVTQCMVSCKAWSRDKGNRFSVHDRIESLTQGAKPGEEILRPVQDVIACTIAAEAKAASVNTKVDSPFAKEMNKFYPGDRYRGGKVDDICVLVAIPVHIDSPGNEG